MINDAIHVLCNGVERWRGSVCALLRDIDRETDNAAPTALRMRLERDCEWRGKLIHVPSGTDGQGSGCPSIYTDRRRTWTRCQRSRPGEMIRRSLKMQRSRSHWQHERRARWSGGTIGWLASFPRESWRRSGDGGNVHDERRMRWRRGFLSATRMSGKPKQPPCCCCGNFRLDAMQAAILLVKLRSLQTLDCRSTSQSCGRHQ